MLGAGSLVLKDVPAVAWCRRAAPRSRKCPVIGCAGSDLPFAGAARPAVCRPDGSHPPLATHAALPVAVPLGGDLVRVFFSGRDAQAFLRRYDCLRLGEDPVVQEASRSGLASGFCRRVRRCRGQARLCRRRRRGDRLYYMGWNVGGAVPWRNAIGLAYTAMHDGPVRSVLWPVMDRDTRSLQSVLSMGAAQRAAGWWMWYGTHLAWGAAQSDMHHAIRTAHSE